jgi:hypothetical protein
MPPASSVLTAMQHRVRSAVGFASVASILVSSAAARAQTMTTGPTIAQSGQLYAERFIGDPSLGHDVGQSTRPTNLNPLGINYSDCIEDMFLQFTVTLSGFTGNDNMQVWATTTGDCTADGTRGNAGAIQPVCWKVSEGLTLPVIQTDSRKFNIPVRALVGPQNAVPLATTLVGDLGPDACTHQPSFAPVPITVWFLPLLSNGLLDTTGHAYQYPTISTDLVGPPPPVGIPSIGDGDTLFVVSWMPNTDADTAGYDIFIDSGQADASVSTPSTSTLYCPDSSAPFTTTDAGDDGSATDAALATDDAASTTDAAGCYYINGGGSLPTGSGGTSCTSTVLVSGIVQDSGTTTVITETDEAGNVIDSGTFSGTGGIATIPCQYLVGTSCPAGQAAYTAINPTVPGKAAGTYTISGLVNGTTYNVVVAAVDNSGNPGPPSPESCDYPAPVNDFWHVYRQDGGRAGGFCALEAVGEPVPSAAGLALIAVTSAFALRRRRRRR